DVGDLGCAKGGVDRYGEAAGQQRAEVRQDLRHAVGVPDGDPVAGLHPGGAQPAGHPGRAVPQLAVGEPFTADLHDRLVVGVALGAAPQHGDDRLVQVAEPGHPVGAADNAVTIESHRAPPLTYRVWPVIWRASSLARNAIAAAMSAGSEGRPSGAAAAAAARSSSGVMPIRRAVSSVIAVTTKPGATALTVRLYGPSSIASVAVRPWMPAFAAE